MVGEGGDKEGHLGWGCGTGGGICSGHVREWCGEGGSCMEEGEMQEWDDVCEYVSSGTMCRGHYEDYVCECLCAV